MTNDFRKYAVKHLGMNGLALDQYAQFTSSYLSPSIMEERQLNVTQMDVFSRLMMDRIIFLGTPIDDYTSKHSCFISILPTRVKIYLFISILPEGRYMPGWVSTIPCSS